MLVTENASNTTIAAQLVKFVHVKCFAHSLNLAAQRALKLPTAHQWDQSLPHQVGEVLGVGPGAVEVGQPGAPLLPHPRF